ncbi:hypothetical protein EYC80_000716 [Monilinia laxa]|uniref:Uncharacterized protein n=1 Tax=Monilinia laxa TaxID=61186 RepID=A0A5N6KBI7_MONLA|nr:hypothetical protein EYC80_000716 [Monilinia laxa]
MPISLSHHLIRNVTNLEIVIRGSSSSLSYLIICQIIATAKYKHDTNNEVIHISRQTSSLLSLTPHHQEYLSPSHNLQIHYSASIIT